MRTPGGPRSNFLGGLTRRGQGGDTAAVLTDLRDAILFQNYLPGTPIPIDGVARLLVVSPIPVREALKVLVGEGLVDHRPAVGYTTSALSFEELSEIRMVRRTLESAVIDQLVERREEQREALAGIEVPTSDPETSADWLLEERRFHLGLVAACGMAKMEETYVRLWNVAERVPALVCGTPYDGQQLRADHEELLRAISEGDRAAAQAACASHYERLEQVAAQRRDDLRFFSANVREAG